MAGVFTTARNAAAEQRLPDSELQRNEDEKAITERHEEQDEQILPLGVALL